MKFTIACLLLFTNQFLFAQQTLSGKIIDAKTNQPIPFANLALLDQAQPASIKNAASDTAGFFEMKTIPNGKYTLTLSLIGYQKFQKEILVTSESPKIFSLGTISMNEEPNLLKEVNITGLTPSFSTTNGQMKIGVANNLFFKSSVNLLDVFKKLPGVLVNQDGALQFANGTTPILFVDGKPVNMSNEEILAYLGSLLPEMVESIELITQPPAKYDGQFHGIIDLRLKRNQTLGLKGTFTTRIQRNNASLLENNLVASFKTASLTYSLSLGHTYGNTYYSYHALQHLANSNSMTTDTRTITANQNLNLQARIVYELKKDQSLDLFLRTYQMNRKANTGNQLFTENATQNNTISLISSKNNALPKQYNYVGGINYDAKFPTSEFHLMASLAQVDNRQTEIILNSNLRTNQLLDYWKTASRNNIFIRTAQTDYTQNLGKSKVELGAKFAYTSTNNELRYDTLGNGIFNLDAKRSNQFLYHEYITAAYISYLGNWNKWSYSAGIRAEYTHSIANSLTTNSLNERNYLKWLPSLNLNYALNKSEQFNFSYSRRLTRPTFEALNPFRFYISPLNYRVGNPNLQPSTTNLFTFSYSRRALLIALNLGRETAPMTRYPEYDPVTNVLAYLGRNLPYKDFGNLQVSAPITFAKWWRANTSVGVYYNRELTPYFGKTYQIGIINYVINGSQVFTLKDWLFEVSYLYESKSGNGLYRMAPVYGVDFGIQKTWLKNRLNTKFTLYNAFDTIKRRLIFREKSIIDNDFYHYFGAQRFVFNLTYAFGSSTYKGKETKKSEEETRAN